MKVMTVLGTRPEIIKLSRVMAELDKHVEHVIVHTGQNYDPQLKDVFFKEMGLRSPDSQHTLPRMGLPVQFGSMFISVDYDLEKHRPDAVLILGDTNSCVAAAYAAKRAHIPIFHMEAGNRCFDDRVPEEVNRRIVDHISDINMPYTEHARRNLLAEGIPADRIIKTGSPMTEVLRHYQLPIQHSRVLEEHSLESGAYIVLSAHREENVDDHTRLRALVDTAARLTDVFRMPVIWTVHPRTRARLKDTGYLVPDLVNMCEPFGFFDYAKLEKNAYCVVSDSGTLTEESSILGFPAVTIRQTHERPEGTDAGVLIMADLDPYTVCEAVKIQAHGWARERVMGLNDYQMPYVSRTVLNAILSYTSYVNRKVWQRL